MIAGVSPAKFVGGCVATVSLPPDQGGALAVPVPTLPNPNTIKGKPRAPSHLPNSVSGVAGQPRAAPSGEALRRPMTPSDDTPQRQRNTNRGLRSEEATERRNQLRSWSRRARRRLSRNADRTMLSRPVGAHEPGRWQSEQLEYNHPYKFATLNVQ